MSEGDADSKQSNARGVAAVIGAFVRSRVAGNLLMVLAIGGGLLMASGIEVELMPEADSKRVAITVPYPGSSPTDVEENVTRRIEERVIGLNGVRQVVSHASAEVGSVTLAVENFTDSEDVLEMARDAIDRIERFPPPNAEHPEVNLPLDRIPAITLAVASSDLSDDSLRQAAEQVREDILALPAVSSVSLEGPAREIAIEVDQEALREHGLTITQVASLLRGSSVDLTSGRLLTGTEDLVVRVHNRRDRAKDFEDIVLLSRPNGSIVTLGDVAQVREGFGDLVGSTEIDGVPAVFINAEATLDGESNVRIAQDVRAMLVDYTPPPGAEVSVWSDTSQRSSARLDMVANMGIMGMVLVLIVLALALDLRLATWVAVGLPVSFLGAIVLFPAFDLTLNGVTLYAMIVTVGIVVDDAVVVGESVAAERERGLIGADAAIEGARRVFWPVAVGIATTFLVFVPLIFTYGLIGQIISVFPVVVGLVLAVSLAEAFLILPSHLSHGNNWSRWPLAAIQSRVGQAIHRLRDNLAMPAIITAVRRPVATLLVAGAVVAASVALVVFEAVRYGQPQLFDTGTVRAFLTFPVGTPIETTRAAALALEAAAERSNEQLADGPINKIATIVGQHRGEGVQQLALGPGATATAAHLATVTVQLHEESARSVSTQEVLRGWRQQAGEVAGAERLVFTASGADPGGDVSLAIIHADAKMLEPAAADLVGAMEAMPGVLDAYHSLTPGRRHFDLRITPAGQAAGLTASGLATQLRARFFGAEVQRFQRGRDEVRVMVRYPEERRRSFSELADERIDLPGGTEIPLSVAARVVESQEFETLMRIDGVPAAEIAAHLDTSQATANQILLRVKDEVLPSLGVRYPGLSLASDRAGIADEASLSSLRYTLPVVLVLIYLLMAVQFRSYAQPLVVLTAMPLAAAGGVLAHLILGYDLNVLSAFGIVAVLGVVINDTLLLMDRYNKLREASPTSPLPAVAAISGAVRDRFRPIFLTTVTTTAGLLPILYLTSAAAVASYIPFVISIIGGLAAGSAGILFVVPAIMLLGEGVGERVTAMRRVQAPAPPAAPP